MQELNQVCKTIFQARTIVVAGHINPDGDCLGSLLALGLGLESLGKRVEMVSSDGVPERYRSIVGVERIKREIDQDVDLAISVDCNSWQMLGGAEIAFKRARSIIEIDHHEFRKPFGTIQLVDSKATAVGELVYLLLKKMKIFITPDIANNILVSIIVETGSFRLPSIRPITFEICAQLMRAGADFYRLVNTLYWAKRKEEVILSGICLSRCRFLCNGKIAWSFINQKDFLRINGKDEDVDTVADEIRAIQGVEAVVFFRQRDVDTVRVSLRSKRVNIASIAEQYQGGGHFDVAGCHIPNTPQAQRRLLQEVVKLINNND